MLACARQPILACFPEDHTIGQSRLVDVPALVQACTEQWHNQTLCPETVELRQAAPSRAEEPTVVLTVEANTVGPEGD